jgi:hypothetical protein
VGSSSTPVSNGNICKHLQIPAAFKTANSAVSSAYTDVYGKFHGWAVQKIFGYSFQAAPEVDVIYKYMNPHHLKVVNHGARLLMTSHGGDSNEQAEDELNPFAEGLAKYNDIVNNNAQPTEVVNDSIVVGREVNHH